MPLVVICGQPCSGKSTVAVALAEVLRSKGLEAEIVSEASLHLERDSCYIDVPSEKKTRGLLRSAVDRRLNKRTVLIVDSLNNIKGYRYELWCIARTEATRYCLVHCDVPEATTRAWNDARRAAGVPCYSASVFEDLARRFEAPSARNRWDMPLFVARPGAASVDEQGGGPCGGLCSGGAPEGVTVGGALGPPAQEEGVLDAARGGSGCDAGRAGVPATLKPLNPRAKGPADAAHGARGAGLLQASPPTAEDPCPSCGAMESRESAGAACSAGGRTPKQEPERPGAEAVPRGDAGCSESDRVEAGGTAAGSGRAGDGKGGRHAPAANGTAASAGASERVGDDHVARSCTAASSGTGAGREASNEHPNLEHPDPDAAACAHGSAAAAPDVAAAPADACDSGLDRVLQEVAAALTDAPAAVRRGAMARELKPNLATAQEPAAATNLLAEVDRAVQDVISAVTRAQALAAGGPAGRVDLGAESAPLELARPAGPAELRRHKRDFLRLATQGGCGVRLGSRAAAMRSFAEYLRGRLEDG